MSRWSISRLMLLPAASVALASRATAAPTPPDRAATAAATIYAALGLQNDKGLDFGMATVTAAGTIVLDPNTDALTATGGVVPVGGTPHAALFEGIAPTGKIVIVRLPKTATTLTRIGGTETMTVDKWTIDGTNRRTVQSKTAFTFRVGGTLHVNANQAEGWYIGTFTVDVQYP